jgi:hypothetical protein
MAPEHQPAQQLPHHAQQLRDQCQVVAAVAVGDQYLFRGRCLVVVAVRLVRLCHRHLLREAELVVRRLTTMLALRHHRQERCRLLVLGVLSPAVGLCRLLAAGQQEDEREAHQSHQHAEVEALRSVQELQWTPGQQRRADRQSTWTSS